MKLLVDEPGSDIARDEYRHAGFKSASALGYVEAVSALTRSRNGGRITAPQFASAVEDLREIWADIDVHAVTADVIQSASRAVAKHGLRAYDGLHLATVLAVAKVERVTFACWDRELREAAAERGIPLLPERLEDDAS